MRQWQAGTTTFEHRSTQHTSTQTQRHKPPRETLAACACATRVLRLPRSYLAFGRRFGSDCVLRTASVSISRSSAFVFNGSCGVFCHWLMDSMWDVGEGIKPHRTAEGRYSMSGFCAHNGHMSDISRCLLCADTVAKVSKRGVTKVPLEDKTSRNRQVILPKARYRSRL